MEGYHVNIYIHICMHIYVYMYVYMSVCMYACMYICICVDLHVLRDHMKAEIVKVWDFVLRKLNLHSCIGFVCQTYRNRSISRCGVLNVQRFFPCAQRLSINPL